MMNLKLHCLAAATSEVAFTCRSPDHLVSGLPHSALSSSILHFWRIFGHSTPAPAKRGSGPISLPDVKSASHLFEGKEREEELPKYLRQARDREPRTMGEICEKKLLMTLQERKTTLRQAP